MEESKYYTPELEEFHVGFECERWIESHPEGFWSEVDEIISKSHLADILLGSEDWIASHFRVRHLDKEDIESLGWESHSVINVWADEDNVFVNGFTFVQNNTETYVLLYDPETNVVGIYLQKIYNEVSGNWSEHICFSGVVQNKSELRKLMKMLQINL